MDNLKCVKNHTLTERNRLVYLEKGTYIQVPNLAIPKLGLKRYLQKFGLVALGMVVIFHDSLNNKNATFISCHILAWFWTCDASYVSD
jgi:hypothetical protein